MGAVVASQSRNACVSGGTPTLTERALERERDQLRAELEQVKQDARELARLVEEYPDVLLECDRELLDKYL